MMQSTVDDEKDVQSNLNDLDKILMETLNSNKSQNESRDFDENIEKNVETDTSSSSSSEDENNSNIVQTEKLDDFLEANFSSKKSSSNDDLLVKEDSNDNKIIENNTLSNSEQFYDNIQIKNELDSSNNNSDDEKNNSIIQDELDLNIQSNEIIDSNENSIVKIIDYSEEKVIILDKSLDSDEINNDQAQITELVRDEIIKIADNNDLLDSVTNHNENLNNILDSSSSNQLLENIILTENLLNEEKNNSKNDIIQSAQTEEEISPSCSSHQFDQQQFNSKIDENNEKTKETIENNDYNILQIPKHETCNESIDNQIDKNNLLKSQVTVQNENESSKEIIKLIELANENKHNEEKVELNEIIINNNELEENNSIKLNLQPNNKTLELKKEINILMNNNLEEDNSLKDLSNLNTRSDEIKSKELQTTNKDETKNQQKVSKKSTNNYMTYLIVGISVATVSILIAKYKKIL